MKRAFDNKFYDVMDSVQVFERQWRTIHIIIASEINPSDFPRLIHAISSSRTAKEPPYQRALAENCSISSQGSDARLVRPQP